jgi:hypothetical protein
MEKVIDNMCQTKTTQSNDMGCSTLQPGIEREPIRMYKVSLSCDLGVFKQYQLNRHLEAFFPGNHGHSRIPGTIDVHKAYLFVWKVSISSYFSTMPPVACV